MIHDEQIIGKIYFIRNKKVMLDEDLAELYNVTTGNLNKSVKRNISRFPDDFMFQLTKEEYNNLLFQIGTSSWGGRRTPPHVFSEQGIAMLSSVLHSERAISVNIQIMRVFTHMREMLDANKEILKKLDHLEKRDIERDDKIMLIFECLRQLEQLKQNDLKLQSRKRVGFKRKGEE